MGNIFNPDFQEFLLALNKNEVNYVLVGGYSVIYHGFPRTTGDLDIFVEVSTINYEKLVQAFWKIFPKYKDCFEGIGCNIPPFK